MPPFDPPTGTPPPASPLGQAGWIPNTDPAAPPPPPAAPAPVAPAVAPPPAAPAPLQVSPAITYYGEQVAIPDAERAQALMQVGYDVEQQAARMAERERAVEGREAEHDLVNQFRRFATRDPRAAAFVDDLMEGTVQVPEANTVAPLEPGDLPAAPDPQLRQLRAEMQRLQGAFQEQSAVQTQDRMEREVETALGEWPALQAPAARDLGRDMLLAAKAKNPRADVRRLAGSVATKLAAYTSATATQKLEIARERTAAVTIPPSVGTPGLASAVPVQQQEEEVRTYAAHKSGGLKEHLKAVAHSQGISGYDWRPNIAPPHI